MEIVNKTIGKEHVEFEAINKSFLFTKKVGWIRIFQQLDDPCHFQIEDFYLDPKFRNRGIGKDLLTTAEKFIEETYNAKIITVYPAPEGEESLSRSTLYKIYEKLGFELEPSTMAYRKVLNKN